MSYKHPTKFREYPAKFFRVVDGDTIQADADLGFRVYARLKVRLYGINAPELKSPGGAEARGELERMLSSGDITIRCVGHDKYDRWVAEVVSKEGLNAGLSLLDKQLVDLYAG